MFQNLSTSQTLAPSLASVSRSNFTLPSSSALHQAAFAFGLERVGAGRTGRTWAANASSVGLLRAGIGKSRLQSRQSRVDYLPTDLAGDYIASAFLIGIDEHFPIGHCRPATMTARCKLLRDVCVNASLGRYLVSGGGS